jgi:hypothetical protein
MAFFTPRGLKIRLDVPYAFTLMSRISPRKKPSEVLTLAEGLESVSSLLGQMSALILLVSGLSWSFITGAMAAGTAVGTLIIMFGAFLVPGLPTISVWWSKIPWPLRWLLALGLVLYLRNWIGIAYWGGALLLSWIVQQIIEFTITKIRFNTTGTVITASEYNFFHAYRLLAVEGDLTTDLLTSPAEVESGKWIVLAMQYAAEYPNRIALDSLVRGG